MANLGNAWHIPANPEPRGVAGMRDPVFPTAPVPSVTIATGNQFAGGGNQGNQLQIGSSLFFKQAAAVSWVEVPLIFAVQIGNNKYYSAAMPTGAFQPGDTLQYYLRIAYDDHDTTFLQLNADGATSATVADENAARANPFSFTVETRDKRGEWGPVFPLPNVGIHAHMLPNGLVLMWGRRDDPSQSLNVDPPLEIHQGGPPAPPAQSTPFLWNPSTGAVTNADKPTLPDGSSANLFCSGHAFLPNGHLFVAGGHLADGQGLNQTTVYDPFAGKWTPSAAMNAGRWYPTVTSLPDGSVLVLSGHFRGPDGSSVPNLVPQVWNAGTFRSLLNNPQGALDLYPRVHVRSSDFVFTTGALEETWSLDTTQWRSLDRSRHPPCQWAAELRPVGPRRRQQGDHYRRAHPAHAFALQASVLAAATGTRVVVGITGTCPYGIAACWGGANEVLHHLDGVEFVDPIPDGKHSTATVFLAADGLPSVQRWRQQFHTDRPRQLHAARGRGNRQRQDRDAKRQPRPRTRRE